MSARGRWTSAQTEKLKSLVAEVNVHAGPPAVEVGRTLLARFAEMDAARTPEALIWKIRLLGERARGANDRVFAEKCIFARSALDKLRDKRRHQRKPAFSGEIFVPEAARILGVSERSVFRILKAAGVTPRVVPSTVGHGRGRNLYPEAKVREIAAKRAPGDCVPAPPPSPPSVERCKLTLPFPPARSPEIPLPVEPATPSERDRLITLYVRGLITDDEFLRHGEAR